MVSRKHGGGSGHRLLGTWSGQNQYLLPSLSDGVCVPSPEDSEGLGGMCVTQDGQTLSMVRDNFFSQEGRGFAGRKVPLHTNGSRMGSFRAWRRAKPEPRSSAVESRICVQGSWGVLGCRCCSDLTQDLCILLYVHRISITAEKSILRAE